MVSEKTFPSHRGWSGGTIRSHLLWSCYPITASTCLESELSLMFLGTRTITNVSHENTAEQNLASMDKWGQCQGGLCRSSPSVQGPGAPMTLGCVSRLLGSCPLPTLQSEDRCKASRLQDRHSGPALPKGMVPATLQIHHSLGLALPFQNTARPTEQCPSTLAHIRFTWGALETYRCLGPYPRHSDLIGMEQILNMKIT